MQPDAVIIGAGASGVCAAHVLSRMGLRVALLDRRAEYAPTFKAEKLEADQIELLEKLDLMDGLEDVLSPVHTVVEYRRSKVVRITPIRQFGMRYEAFVNRRAALLPPGVTRLTATVAAIECGEELQSVRLQDGSTIQTRLIVNAAGTANRLRHAAGARQLDVSRSHMVAFGFDLQPQSGRLPHDGVNFFPDRFTERVGFLTLFPVPGTVRANLFTYWDPSSELAQRMRSDPGKVLDGLFSGMRAVIGQYHVAGRVSGAAVDLWTTETPLIPGMVLIGDAFQSVCPATGTGLSKLLSDIYVLREQAGSWFASPGMSAAKLSAYYSSPLKLQSDRHSLQLAADARQLATEHSWRFRKRRLQFFTLAPLRGRVRLGRLLPLRGPRPSS